MFSLCVMISLASQKHTRCKISLDICSDVVFVVVVRCMCKIKFSFMKNHAHKYTHTLTQMSISLREKKNISLIDFFLLHTVWCEEWKKSGDWLCCDWLTHFILYTPRTQRYDSFIKSLASFQTRFSCISVFDTVGKRNFSASRV
jgi:hypothetical protein